jgi:uncharacterized membrane protein
MAKCMKSFARYFLRGCLVLAPLAATIYILYLIFITVDQVMPVGVPGLGFLLTLGLITLVGFLSSGVIGRTVVSTFEHLLQQVPFVKLVYTSLKDLVSAVVGDKRRFDSPVAVALIPGSSAQALGFVTRTSLQRLGIEDRVAVYFPQSYNFAGNLLLVPRSLIQPLVAHPGDLMTFIVSGGVTGLGVGRTDEALLGAQGSSGKAAPDGSEPPAHS